MTRQEYSQVGPAPTSQNSSAPAERPPAWADALTMVTGRQIDDDGGTAERQRWSGEWRGDELLSIHGLTDGDCPGKTGASCLNLSVARNKHTLAERQIVELSHRFVNMLQTLAIRIERHKRIDDDPDEQNDLDESATRTLFSTRLRGPSRSAWS